MHGSGTTDASHSTPGTESTHCARASTISSAQRSLKHTLTHCRSCAAAGCTQAGTRTAAATGSSEVESTLHVAHVSVGHPCRSSCMGHAVAQDAALAAAVEKHKRGPKVEVMRVATGRRR